MPWGGVLPTLPCAPLSASRPVQSCNHHQRIHDDNCRHTHSKIMLTSARCATYNTDSHTQHKSEHSHKHRQDNHPPPASASHSSNAYHSHKHYSTAHSAWNACPRVMRHQGHSLVPPSLQGEVKCQHCKGTGHIAGWMEPGCPVGSLDDV
jgi:hypothetical protein